MVMNTDELIKFFEDNDFNVYPSIQNNIQCCEIETWTDGGVDMIMFLNPFTVEEFIQRVENFDIDEEIDMNRQSKDYRNAFTISESVKDFNRFKKRLKRVAKELIKLNEKKDIAICRKIT